MYWMKKKVNTMDNKSLQKTEWRYFSNLKTQDELETYMAKRVSGHSHFFHYTNLKAIDKILEKPSFRISQVKRFNDKKDVEQFGTEEEQKRFFSMCFSSGVNENLSLWYLYSGMDGKGGCLRFTQNKLRSMIEKGTFSIVEYNYKKNEEVGMSTLLKKDVDMNIEFKDVLYARIDKSGKNVSLKYNTMTNYNNLSVEEYEKYVKNNKGFQKKLIWYYEKETRLLIEIKGEIARKLNAEKDYAVMWEFDKKLLKGMQIKLAPENKNEDVINECKNIKRFMLESSGICLSENAGDVEMNLCGKCDKNKIKKIRKRLSVKRQQILNK